MHITTSTTPALEQQTDHLANACHDPFQPEEPLIAALDEVLGGHLRKAITAERFLAKAAQQLVLPTLGRLPAARVALLGLGPTQSVDTASLRGFAARAARLANAHGAASLALLLPSGPTSPVAPDPSHAAQLLTEGVLLGGYRFDRYLAEERRVPRSLTTAQLLLGPASPPLDAAIQAGVAGATAVARARDLVNEPAAVMTPTRLANVAADIAATSGLDLVVLDREACRARRMGLYLAVAQGSVEEPRFIHLTWKPPAPRRRVVLVGKGVTFDSGGLSLKPNDSMLDMKTDMAGAAAVISVMSAIAQLALPVEVHALAACTENMPSGSAYKLGDVLRASSGKTVEINNTDAEGRLTLADALTYALGLAPDAILDFATLTGACMVALGPHTAGVMSNDEPLATAWLTAARSAGEDMWRLPLPERLLEQLKSDVADLKNTGERWGGALTAGLFLREFVGAIPWVHVDIAGPSTADKDLGAVSKGATGFPVATILEYLRRLGDSP